MAQWGGNMNYRPESKKEKTQARRRATPEKVAPTRSAVPEWRVGKTIAGSANEARQRNLEHIALRKKRQRRNAIIVILILAAIATLAIFIAKYLNDLAERRAAELVQSNPMEPTVKIVDENAGENISQRVKTFVARAEADAKTYNIEIDHVVLPAGKAREIDLYFKGRKEYYKMTLERGSTVQIEDAKRMMVYLDGKEKTPDYVDLRVEGKAYYK